MSIQVFGCTVHTKSDIAKPLWTHVNVLALVTYVTEGGARAWHMFYGIGAVDEALHIKSGVPMGVEFASEIGA